MDSSCSLTSQTDDETKALGALLETFYPVFTLQEIASAYCRAGSDLCKASDILCQLQDSNPNAVQPENDNSINNVQPVESLCEDNVKETNCIFRGSKSKKASASVGTVSCVLGKAYARSTSSKKEIIETTKPLKLEVKGTSIDEVETGSVKLEEHLDHKDTEEFLFSMLGDGFMLSRDMIQEVLGCCGYDVKKSMEELFAISERVMDKGNEISYDTETKNSDKFPNSEVCLPMEINKTSSQLVRKTAEPTSHEKERSNLPQELLKAIFNVPDRWEEEPKKRLEMALNRTRVFGCKVVKEPLRDIAIKPLPDLALTLCPSEHVDDKDDTYWMLRQNAKKHWDKMKELYKAAVEAYASGDRARADDLLEGGRYYNRMAREADEKSAVEILATKKSETQDDIPLDLHFNSARESLRLLKKHLVSLANIPRFRYLKVIVNTDAEDTTKGKRKRMVIKLLERESVKWTEEDGNPGTILIWLNEIDPSKFTFTNDPQ